MIYPPGNCASITVMTRAGFTVCDPAYCHPHVYPPRATLQLT